MNQTPGRRKFLLGSTALAAGLGSAGVAAARSQNGHPGHDSDAATDGAHESPQDDLSIDRRSGDSLNRGKLAPGRRGIDEPPVRVQAPDLDVLPWEMKDGVKEFHLSAEHVRREFLPGRYFDVWGYNESMPGPTIEAVEGDRVRIIVQNNLPESTTVHWHGIEVPNRFDGVHGLTQNPIPAGEMFVYEFELHQNGTFFYHSHGPMQEGMGMVGLFIVYPRDTHVPAVDHDFALVVQEFAILPLNTVPNTMSMEFNFFTINGRSGPYTTPLVVRQGDRVRIRFLNFSAIDHHPMHLHGHTFWVTGTEGGRIPETAWIPGNNVLVGVAQVREVEFIAHNPGDWMIHCHMFHHMMNHMVSMVGPMEMKMDSGGEHGGHQMGSAPRRMPAGLGMAQSLGMIARGAAISSENGASLGRGLGEQSGQERSVRNGPQASDGGVHAEHGGQAAPEGANGGHAAHGAGGASQVPGFPQDMMDMHGMMSEDELAKINKPETRGMRANWHAGVEALMTVLRVLPADLYDKVNSGKGNIPEGASVPDGESGDSRMHHKT